MKRKDLKNFIKEVLSEELNPQDKITMDVPLFIRALEYAKEDAKTDMDLHDAAEKAILASEGGKTLTMADYDGIFGSNEMNEYSVYQGDVRKMKPEPTPKEGEIYLKDLKPGDKFSPIDSDLEYILVKPTDDKRGVEVKYADGSGNMKFRGNVLVKKTKMNEDDQMQSDDESDMASSQLLSIKSNTEELMNMINRDEQLDAWVQAKLTKAQDYLEAVSNYLKGENNQSTINESDMTNPREIAIKVNKEIEAMPYGTDSNERYALIQKYTKDKSIADEASNILDDLMRDDSSIRETPLTTAEKNKKEEIVKAMKKTFKGPKPVMYAIATDKAKKMAEIIAKKIKSK